MEFYSLVESIAEERNLKLGIACCKICEQILFGINSPDSKCALQVKKFLEEVG